MNVLRWTVGDQAVRRSHPPRDVQPFDPFLGSRRPVVSPAELQESAFSEAHLRGSKPTGWRAASSIAVEAAAQLAAGERFVYCYYGGIDKIAHERGFGPYYEAELRFADHSWPICWRRCRRTPRCWSPPTMARSTSATNIVHPSADLLAERVVPVG